MILTLLQLRIQLTRSVSRFHWSRLRYSFGDSHREILQACSLWPRRGWIWEKRFIILLSLLSPFFSQWFALILQGAHGQRNSVRLYGCVQLKKQIGRTIYSFFLFPSQWHQTNDWSRDTWSNHTSFSGQLLRSPLIDNWVFHPKIIHKCIHTVHIIGSPLTQNI
jgi:hypothetical protein